MMTMDAAIDAFAEADSLPTEAIEWVLEEWDTTGPLCRALLHDYLGGADLSERTERALYTVIHLLGERGDTRCFPDLCRLALDSERCNSVLGDDGMSASLPPILISTFDGDRAALHRLVETPDVDEVLRADTLLVLAYLARRRQFPEADMYEYLSGLTDRLQATGQDFVWFGWIRAVAALGFAGLSGRVEQILRRGLVDPALIDSAAFWADLRESQDDPQGTSSRAWEGIGPMGRTVEWLASEADANDAEAAPMEPIRNPMRQIGRNDPCPCGSGKKYKKCCLVA